MGKKDNLPMPFGWGIQKKREYSAPINYKNDEGKTVYKIPYREPSQDGTKCIEHHVRCDNFSEAKAIYESATGVELT